MFDVERRLIPRAPLFRFANDLLDLDGFASFVGARRSHKLDAIRDFYFEGMMDIFFRGDDIPNLQPEQFRRGNR